jgi:2-polyprenyl-3-methyl-5-hydroxy-6-metoxy-1,4-benzoquinol methylase
MAKSDSDSLREIAYAFQQSRILLTAFEMDLFSAIAPTAQGSAKVAESLGTDPRATDRLMNALCAMGLLEKQGEKYSNAPLAARFLVRGKPEYMGGLMHTVNLWNTWSTLSDAVRKGRAVANRRVHDRDDRWLTGFIAAMNERASKQAPSSVAMLDLAGVSRVLDVGGGSGAYAMAFVRAKQGITATVFDLPNVIPLTKAYIEKEGLSERVRTVIGDYTKHQLGSGYDLVFLSAIVHSNDGEENLALIKKCASALNPHGQVVVQDFIMNEDRTGPTHGAFFALNMLVGTEAGDTYTESEVRSWMEQAGFSRIRRNDTQLGTTQIVGRKG